MLFFRSQLRAKRRGRVLVRLGRQLRNSMNAVCLSSARAIHKHGGNNNPYGKYIQGVVASQRTRYANVIVARILLYVVTILTVLLYAFNEQSGRVLYWAASQNPNRRQEHESTSQ
jgi:hypothetical protein